MANHINFQDIKYPLILYFKSKTIMKQLFIFLISSLLLIVSSSCQKQVNNSDYRQYIIVRFDRKYVDSVRTVIPIVTVNDGAYSYHDDPPRLTDDNGKELNFKSSVGVINYMVSQGWKFEGLITPHILEADIDDCTLSFSKSISKAELEKIVQRGFR